MFNKKITITSTGITLSIFSFMAKADPKINFAVDYFSYGSNGRCMVAMEIEKSSRLHRMPKAKACTVV
ncbi:hypothetical protein AM628_14415 [Vibrio cholerae O1 biovar El Tor]|nr:hypothetical protein AM628_14415 [Vibrio cholerae O1 biovar El Tor]